MPKLSGTSRSGAEADAAAALTKAATTAPTQTTKKTSADQDGDAEKPISSSSLFSADLELLNFLLVGPETQLSSTRSWRSLWRHSEKDGQPKSTVAGFSKQSRPNDLQQRFLLEPQARNFGGYGQVFLASDKQVEGRTVAVKVLEGQSKRLTASFRDELQALTALDHPNIVRLHHGFQSGPGSSKSYHYLVLEHLAGGDTFDLLSTRGPLPEHFVSGIMRQVVSALEYAHGKGFAHRDVKPENICCCSLEKSTPLVKLIDWGTSANFHANAMTGIVGQPPYAAPEMFDGTYYTAACDMWSAGVTAYVLLSSKQPFWGTRQQQLDAERAESFPLDHFNWSRSTKDFLVELLRFDPTLRPTAKASLKSLFLAKKESGVPHLARQALENMQRFDFEARPLVQLALLTASYLDNSLLAELSEVFDWLDVERTGVLTKENLRTGFQKAFGSSSQQANNEKEKCWGSYGSVSGDLEAVISWMEVVRADHIAFKEFCAMCIGPVFQADDKALLAACQHISIPLPCGPGVHLGSCCTGSSRPHSTTSSSMISVCSTRSSSGSSSSGRGGSPIPTRKEVCRNMAKGALARFTATTKLSLPNLNPNPTPTSSLKEEKTDEEVSAAAMSPCDSDTTTASSSPTGSSEDEAPPRRWQSIRTNQYEIAGGLEARAAPNQKENVALIVEWLSDARKPNAAKLTPLEGAANASAKTTNLGESSGVRRSSATRRLLGMLGHRNSDRGPARPKTGLMQGLFSH